MRLTSLKHVTVAEPNAHPLELLGARGERVRLAILDHDLVRVQLLPDGAPRLNRTWMIVNRDGTMPRAGRCRDDLAPFALPPFALTREAERILIRTQVLQIELTLDPFALNWSDAQGNAFASDCATRAYAYDRAGQSVLHYLEHRPTDLYFGLGERAGELNHAGKHFRMLNLDAINYNAEKTDPLYKHFPFYITFDPDTQIAYGILYDNLATTTFDLGGEIDNYHGRFRTYRAEAGDLDYYMIYGPSIRAVVEKLSALIGRMILPPRWSLGYLGSTMSYTEAPDAHAQLQRFVALCAEHQIPCDGFHLSSGYTTDADNRRNVFTWNRERIPEPRTMVENFTRAGIKLAPNIKPALLSTHPRYAEVAALGGFIRQADSDAPEVVTFWGGEGSYIDFTSDAGFNWWKQNVREQLLAYGIASTWNDNNEFEIWDDAARCAGFGEPLPIGLARPVQTLLMARASFEAQTEFRPDERPYLISRSGCPGIQRYAQTWSGDNFTSWNTLKFNIPMGLGISLSGAPNTGHDVGGFGGDAPSPELFVRWVQNGVFHPRFTIHSWHWDGSVNEPWMYPDVLPIIRAWIEFRYRLIPYLYSLMFEAAETGHPIIRPMVYEFPDDPNCQATSFDFMLGTNLLIATVLQNEARRRPVYLPRATAWCDWYTGGWHTAGGVVSADAPLERVPLFVRANGIVPMGKVMRHIGAERDDVRQVFVFPHPVAGHSTFALIEDDGISLGYQRGEITRVALHTDATPAQVVLGAEAHGNFALPYSTLEFILPPHDTRRIIADGDAWTDDQARQHVVIRV